MIRATFKHMHRRCTIPQLVLATLLAWMESQALLAAVAAHVTSDRLLMITMEVQDPSILESTTVRNAVRLEQCSLSDKTIRDLTLTFRPFPIKKFPRGQSSHAWWPTSGGHLSTVYRPEA